MDPTEAHLPGVDQRRVELGSGGSDGPRAAPRPFTTAIRPVTMLRNVMLRIRSALSPIADSMSRYVTRELGRSRVATLARKA